MKVYRRVSLLAVSVVALSALARAVSAQVPDAIAAPGETVVVTLHAEGAQVYECKAEAGGKLAWQFREPIATLLLDGRTVGRHYAGPSWGHGDGSAVKVAARAPGASPKDIPWLKLETTERRGTGLLSGVTTIQRVKTEGGTAEGACERAGAYLSVPYAAEYVFLRK